jgi:hypothetical protein
VGRLAARREPRPEKNDLLCPPGDEGLRHHLEDPRLHKLLHAAADPRPGEGIRSTLRKQQGAEQKDKDPHPKQGKAAGGGVGREPAGEEEPGERDQPHRQDQHDDQKGQVESRLVDDDQRAPDCNRDNVLELSQRRAHLCGDKPQVVEERLVEVIEAHLKIRLELLDERMDAQQLIPGELVELVEGDVEEVLIGGAEVVDEVIEHLVDVGQDFSHVPGGVVDQPSDQPLGEVGAADDGADRDGVEALGGGPDALEGGEEGGGDEE